MTKIKKGCFNCCNLNCYRRGYHSNEICDKYVSEKKSLKAKNDRYREYVEKFYREEI